MNKVSTGIPGLDALIGGGLIEGSTVLVCGCTGTGKSIFGLQFLYSGARDHGEPGILVTLESRPEEIRTAAMQLGWDLRELEKQRLLMMVDAASGKAGLPTSEKYALRRGFDMTTFAEEVYLAISECNARRLVIDSLSGLGIRFGEPFEARSELFRVAALLRERKVTSVLIGETPMPNDQSLVGVEKFVCQGLISLDLKEHDGGLERSLVIWKMHNTAHSMKRHPFVIGQRGIAVKAQRSKSAGRS